MAQLTQEALDGLREHFNAVPYLHSKEELPYQPDFLFSHSLITASYRRNGRVVSTAGKTILDAGCGTGYKGLALARANPGAKIVGVDLSENSVELARQRMAQQNIDNCEFHVLTVESLPELGMKFDYINCDDVLYLIPDAVEGLHAMQEVLAPDGILRVNHHSVNGRRKVHLAQEAFKMLGMMSGPPCQEEVELVRQTVRLMRGDVELRSTTWSEPYFQQDEKVLANYLLRGDKVWSVKEFFTALEQANLAFISMVDWWSWDLMALFDHKIDELPMEIAFALAEMSQAEQIHFYDTVHGKHRLLDLWCGLPQDSEVKPIEAWTQEDWQTVAVHFHPQALTPEFVNDLQAGAETSSLLDLTNYPHLADAQAVPYWIDSLTLGCLVPLLLGPQSLNLLKQRWLQLRPLNPLTLQPSEPDEADYPLQSTLVELERRGYVMLERNAVG
jgi:2-polyprenyl-3-methyl-5-hydroxy-6-metoxy-1,4-benzoquinol methylase